MRAERSNFNRLTEIIGLYSSLFMGLNKARETIRKRSICDETLFLCRSSSRDPYSITISISNGRLTGTTSHTHQNNIRKYVIRNILDNSLTVAPAELNDTGHRIKRPTVPEGYELLELTETGMHTIPTLDETDLACLARNLLTIQIEGREICLLDYETNHQRPSHIAEAVSGSAYAEYGVSLESLFHIKQGVCKSDKDAIPAPSAPPAP